MQQLTILLIMLFASILGAITYYIMKQQQTPQTIVYRVGGVGVNPYFSHYGFRNDSDWRKYRMHH